TGVQTCALPIFTGGPGHDLAQAVGVRATPVHPPAVAASGELDVRLASSSRQQVLDVALRDRTEPAVAGQATRPGVQGRCVPVEHVGELVVGALPAYVTAGRQGPAAQQATILSKQ